MSQRENLFRIIFLGLPIRIEKEKSTNFKIPLGGAQVAESEIFEALLKYFNCKSIVVVPIDLDFKFNASERLAHFPNSDRVEIVYPEEIHSLPLMPTVIFQGNTRLSEGASFRYNWGCNNWPLIAITHALSGTDAFMSVMVRASNPTLFTDRDRLICTSKVGETAWKEIESQICKDNSEKKIGTEVIPLGIEPSKFIRSNKANCRARLKLPQNEVVFLCFGRFSTEMKMDPLPLLVAFREVLKDSINLRLILAGDATGGGVEKIKKISSALEIDQQITIIENPSLEIKFEIYNASDIFISFSDNIQETFGLSLIEAMGFGLPIIATDWSGYREIVKNGETGYLVSTHWSAEYSTYASKVAGFSSEVTTHKRMSWGISINYTQAIQAMKTLADNPNLRVQMGNKGRVRVISNFSWQQVMQNYENLFNELLDSEELSKPSTRVNYNITIGYDCYDAFQHYSTSRGSLRSNLYWTQDLKILNLSFLFLPSYALEGINKEWKPLDLVDFDSLVQTLSLYCRLQEVHAIIELLMKYGVILKSRKLFVDGSLVD